MPPMATAKSTEKGEVSDALCEYYRIQSTSRPIGLIITEHSYICSQGKANKNQLSISCDQDIEGLRQLVEVIHRSDTKVMAQINHAGTAAIPDDPDTPPVGPSPIPHPRTRKTSGKLACELSKKEIKTIVQQFVDAAVRAKTAGYDGVEIHSAHGYLLNQFYSPLTNKRTDEYGATCIENRVRFHLEVIKAIRCAIGKDYPLALRLGGCDYTNGGSTITDSIKASLLFEQAGLDLLDLSGGVFGYMRSDIKEPGYFRDMSTLIKQHVSIPVILTGGVTTPQEAEKLLAENCADLIGVGRALLSSADIWNNNVMQ